MSDRTASLALTVTAPASSYSLSLSAGAASIQQGNNTSVTLNVARTNFAGNVNLAITGLPSGATANILNNPVTGNSTTLAFFAGTAAPGTYPVTVTGTATGQTDRTVQFALTITPGPVTTTSVTLQNTAFNPPDIRVSPSAVVTWTNQDNTTHNVTFASPLVGNSGDFSTGSKSITMPAAAGTYNYRCTIHAGMSGTVQVQ